MPYITQIFMVLFGLILFIGVPIGFVCIFIYARNVNKAFKAENKAYENMIISPSDTTVSQYISVFQNTKKHINIEDKIRQSQGYKEVANSTNVSEELKNKLKMVLLSNGVPIEM